MASKPTADSDKALVLVCGAARSGTTMLDLMLGNSADAFSSGEIYALFRPFRKHHFEPICTCGDPNCKVWELLRNVPESEFHSTVLSQPGIRYVIDSSKDLRWVLDSNEWARTRGINVRNVLIWKNPIDLAYSHWKRGRPVDYFRRQYLNYHQRLFDLELPFVSVSYNRLVDDSAGQLIKLCQHIGIDYQSGREEFWHKQHHHFFGSAGAASQVKQGESRLRLQQDFPVEFINEYNRKCIDSCGDDHLAQTVARLESTAIDSADGRKLSFAATSTRRGRPGWYYRHAFKAAFRRYFPERRAIVD